MPKVGYCPHCKKGYMYSTYQMIEHYNKYHSIESKKRFVNDILNDIIRNISARKILINKYKK